MARFVNIVSLEIALKRSLSFAWKFFFSRFGELCCLRQGLVKYNPGISHRSCCQSLHAQHLPNSFPIEHPVKSKFLLLVNDCFFMVFKFESAAESPKEIAKAHQHSRGSDSVNLKCGLRVYIFHNLPSDVNAVGEGFSLWETLLSPVLEKFISP